MSNPEAANGRAPYRGTKVFINYRRDGSAGDAERLHDELKRYFFGRHLFLDVKSIRMGDSFPLAIETALASCGALIAVIGPRWLSANDERGRRRLDDPSDMVRREVSAALAKGTWVIPVLMHGAAMPEAKELPDDLRRLAECQAIEIRSGYWERDVKELVALLKRRLYRRRRLATIITCGAALFVVLVLSYFSATAALPVVLSPDGENRIPDVRYRPRKENVPPSEDDTGPRELVIEGLADADEVFLFDGNPLAQVRVNFDVARFQESTIKQFDLDSDFGTKWEKAIYSWGRDDPTAKVDYEQACTTSVEIIPADGSAPPTMLRLFQQDPPGGASYRAISLNADSELAVNLNLKSGPANSAGCSKQYWFGKARVIRVGRNAGYLTLAGAPFHFQFGSIDPDYTSPRKDLLRLKEDGILDIPLSMRARRVVVRAYGGRETSCADFSAQSADDKSSLSLQRLEIGPNYFRLVAEGNAYVESLCESVKPPLIERLSRRRVPVLLLLLASACLALSGLVYSFVKL